MTTHKVELTFTLTLEGEGYTSYNINITYWINSSQYQSTLKYSALIKTLLKLIK